jgi:hypothetical protein
MVVRAWREESTDILYIESRSGCKAPAKHPHNKLMPKLMELWPDGSLPFSKDFMLEI